jgi:trimethylamine corrinoid protein
MHAADFEAAKQSILRQDKDQALEIAKQLISEGHDPLDIMNNGFITGIQEVGELFGHGRVFLPELISAGETMKAVTELMDAAMPEKHVDKKGTIVVATVKGDVHDIGKGIVISILRAHGLDVHDLGRDVSTDHIIEQAEKVGADIIGTSALLTTTMPKQKELEEALTSANLRSKYKTIVGGAPVTSRWAERIGANAYAADAQDAVVKIVDMLKDG